MATVSATVGLELWKSDGTSAGTILVKDIPDGEAPYDEPTALTDVAGRLFFNMNDGAHGFELWTSDGTSAGTALVEDIDPHDGDPHYGGPSWLTEFQGKLFFTSDDETHRRELWKSDGTAAGTVLVKDVNQGGGFAVTGRKRNLQEGALRLKVDVKGAGVLARAPVGKPWIKAVTRDVESAGRTTLRVKACAEGRKKLERVLREALREGRKVGKLKVGVCLTFIPSGGSPSSQTHRFTLELSKPARRPEH